MPLCPWAPLSYILLIAPATAFLSRLRCLVIPDIAPPSRLPAFPLFRPPASPSRLLRCVPAARPPYRTYHAHLFAGAVHSCCIDHRFALPCLSFCLAVPFRSGFAFAFWLYCLLFGE
ncbi:hypothetical protein B0H15DRAFT_337852 [Mycena belliarum]|uniref:Uncharacterized protein n=1 Tax=Mycena belliarum TaxID=1033014 RepID=A0AAD6UIP3_9AGAR|nr:hypothetical protein B0H15DRAFT_337852 [Mycena belliae]